jgi:mandelate racemase
LTSFDPPLLRSLTGTAAKLPTNRPLGASAKSIDEACLVLVDLLTVDGVVGHGYAFCYQPSIAQSLVPIIAEPGEFLARRRLAAPATGSLGITKPWPNIGSRNHGR